LGVKGSKPNFTSMDHVFFPNRRTTTSPKSHYYLPKRGIKSLETIEVKKKKRKRGREWEEIM